MRAEVAPRRTKAPFAYLVRLDDDCRQKFAGKPRVPVSKEKASRYRTAGSRVVGRTCRTLGIGEPRVHPTRSTKSDFVFRLASNVQSQLSVTPIRAFGGAMIYHPRLEYNVMLSDLKNLDWVITNGRSNEAHTRN